jgi:protein-disulfide isomerase
MKNSHLLMIVGGTAAAGLLVGNLLSRSPSVSEQTAAGAVAERRPSPTAVEPRRAAPQLDQAPSVPSPQLEMAEAAPRDKPKAKQGVSDERKTVVLHPEDPSLGPASAKVTVVEFSDFQCPYCSKAAATVHQVREAYGDKVRLVFKHHPLPFHKDAPLAHQAAAEANAQGRFWELHDRLFANQKSLQRADLEASAQSLGLDMARFRAALDSSVHKAHIDADATQAVELGASGTPAFFINGRFLSGAQPFDVFKTAIDEELAR